MSVVCNNDYETKLFRTAFSLAFHGFMRVGELSVGSKNNQMHTVAIENINIFDNKLEVLLTSSKTDQGVREQQYAFQVNGIRTYVRFG